MRASRRFVHQSRRLLQAATALVALAGAAAALAQKVDNIPPAVQNNVAPNFMFMIDNSGSMSNIVPASPYIPSATYLSSCPSGSTIPAGSSVDVRIGSGSPTFVVGGTTYRHTTVAGSAPARCFNNTATYGARLLGDSVSGSVRSPGNYLDSDYSGHYLNWYFGNYGGPIAGWADRKLLSSGMVETRMEVARAAAKSVMDTLPLPGGTGVAAVRVGLSTYTSGGGALRVAVGNFTSSTRTTLKNSIDGLAPSGVTPLASTFADIARYLSTGYNGDVATANDASVNIDSLLRLNGTDNASRNACLAGAPSCTAAASARPIQYWCQRSSLFAITDGRPQGDRSFNSNTYMRDYDRDCSGVNSGNCVSSGAAGSWDRKTGRTYESNGSDYMDDLAKLMQDVDWRPDLTKPVRTPPAKNNIITYMIGFADPTVQNDPLLINTAEQGGGRFIAATDGPELESAMRSIIADALAKDAAAAAVAVTNVLITAGSTGFASSYNSGSWYGDLEAYSLDVSTGQQSGAAAWSFRTRLNAQSAASRKIATYSGTAGIAFTTANGAALRAATPSLTDGVINYTRGDRSGEGSSYRIRPWVLGDIINAEPVVVNYGSTPIVFQAANDGMLHVINGSTSAADATRGQELWAYVPKLVHAKLAGRAAEDMTHEYLVDGTPAAAEVTGVGSVTRMLAGGLNKGGAGYYALDISSGTAATEAAAAAKVMWEFKPANMGYSFGIPQIVKTAAGWKIVVTSGLRNDTSTDGLGGDGRGRVWVLNPADGTVDKVFATPSGYGSSTTAIGLAHLGRLANTTADAVTRWLWAGDLQGNLWRIDLDAASGANLTRIAALTAPNGSIQPITAPPVVGPVAGSSTKFFVYVGTGQYLSIDDVPGTSGANAHATQVQSLYGIIDDTSVAAPTMPNLRGSNGTSCPADGGDGALVCQSATLSAGVYAATHNALDVDAKRGFYMDLPITGGRVNTMAALTTRGTLLFAVNLPTNATCEPGGSSYLFQVSAATGGAVARTYGGTTYFDAGFALGPALSSRPVLIRTSTGTRALLRFSDRTTQSREVGETAGSAAGFRRIYVRPMGNN